MDMWLKMGFIIEINSLIFRFLFWERVLNPNFLFSKLIGIVGSSGYLDECDLCFGVLIKKILLEFMIVN